MEKSGINSVISWCFLLYFGILFAERVQSLVRSVSDSSVNLYGSGFDGYVNTLTLLSLVATVVLLVGWNADFWRSLFNTAVLPNYTMLTATAGVLLFSGMVHTEYTIAPIQFASYGVLILAMVLKTVLATSGASHPFMLWYSLAFVTVFSMAIPVMYRSTIANATLFHIIEAVTAIVLVCCFTLMLRNIFIGQAEDLLFWAPMLMAIVGDALIICMRWDEKVNMFVLIFALLATVLFAIGKIVFFFLKKA